jgi:hypothetical protein
MESFTLLVLIFVEVLGCCPDNDYVHNTSRLQQKEEGQQR